MRHTVNIVSIQLLQRLMAERSATGKGAKFRTGSAFSYGYPIKVLAKAKILFHSSP